ncbi:hypothetical protein [Amycolatopsis alkalitolerans]|uniref:Uncharacterized protein n=1 Tax=Amycolatopsis alkalitolerans TaxID=2547244 RepID=A0A5C4LRV5_9PSEU|nr:hypothetical protein [Amycolatopsis alkalitolerans]TNC18724.1 hypothetical protein FG385_33535 [Amycolatopsis alkalitolerans]
MAGRTKDTTARARIKGYLAEHGPIADRSGGATTMLREAIDYKGSSVAFIQLVTAMDQAGEIQREIKGKRTYGIRLGAQQGAEVGATIPAPQQAAGHTASGAQIDYDLLAQALLRQLVRSLAPAVGSDVPVSGVSHPVDVESSRDLLAERDQLRAERDEYLKRLETSRRQLNALMALYVREDADQAAVAEGRELLARLKDAGLPDTAAERAS